MNGDKRYMPIEEILPTIMPKVTRKEIIVYYNRLIKKFGKAKDAPEGMYLSFQRCNTRYRARMCWASTKPTTGHHKGWGRMIHDASHRVFRWRHPSFKPHDGGHATLEREMAEYVMRKGWLTK
jgi:hypothetical protein